MDSKEKILSIALKLFLEKGYKKVSYDLLIKKSGMSKGAIYHYFSSKDELLMSVFKFLMSGTESTKAIEPQKTLTDYQSFVDMFNSHKLQQLDMLKKKLQVRTLKLNKLKFLIEVLGENEQLKKIVREKSKEEIKFFEECFITLKKNGHIAKNQNVSLLAENLFLILQGIEFQVFFDGTEDTMLINYARVLNNFGELL